MEMLAPLQEVVTLQKGDKTHPRGCEMINNMVERGGKTIFAVENYDFNDCLTSFCLHCKILDSLTSSENLSHEHQHYSFSY